MEATAMLPGGGSRTVRLRRRGTALARGTQLAGGRPLRRRTTLGAGRLGAQAALGGPRRRTVSWTAAKAALGGPRRRTVAWRATRAAGGGTAFPGLRRRATVARLGARGALGGRRRRTATWRTTKGGAKAAAGTARRVDTDKLAQALALAADARPRRRRRRITPRRVLVAIGLVGGGVAIARAMRSGDQEQIAEGPNVETARPAEAPRSDREMGGPTSPAEPSPATGGAPGTPPDSGFEPHR